MLRRATLPARLTRRMILIQMRTLRLCSCSANKTAPESVQICSARRLRVAMKAIPLGGSYVVLCSSMGKRRLLPSKQSRRRIRKSCGYVLLPIILWGWIAGTIGIPAIAIISGLVLVFLMINADMPCGAETRERDRETGEFLLCRNPSSGMLVACAQYKAAHRWGCVNMLAKQSSWGRVFRTPTSTPNGKAAAVSALASSCSALIALLALLANSLK
jgi:hypothetical protein